jgi:hypothetical protein
MKGNEILCHIMWRRSLLHWFAGEVSSDLGRVTRLI